MSMESVRSDRFTIAVRVAFLALSCLALAPSWSSAAVFWEDGLEPGNTGYTAVGGMNFSSSVVAHGSHSLRLFFPSINVQAGTFTDRYFPPTTNIYSRFYFRLDNFTVANQTKIVEFTDYATGSGPSYWWNMSNGNPELNVHAQLVLLPDGTLGTKVFYPNQGNARFQNGQWYCVELHIQHNTPGVADGLIEAWKDGQQILYYPNLKLREATQIGNHDPNRKFTINRLYAQYGQGEMYFDSMAVGDQRIGCSGTPPQVTPTPPAPTPTTPAPTAPAPTAPAPTAPAPTAPAPTAPQPTAPSLVPPPAPQGLYIR